MGLKIEVSYVMLPFQDCKSKTKRMLLEKMGTEAIELGLSGETSVTGVEENTMIASLCDLMEKVWSHGVASKQGKSALWAHLTAYLDSKDKTQGKLNANNYLSPGKFRLNESSHIQNKSFCRK